MSGLDLLDIGKRCEIGQHTFTDETIIAYARRFDPQPFHIGHTTAVWMKLNAQYYRTNNARLLQAGRYRNSGHRPACPTCAGASPPTPATPSAFSTP